MGKGKKVKCTLVQVLRLCTGRTAHRGSRGIALLFLDHGTRREWSASRPGCSLPPGKDSVPIVQGAGRGPGSVWTGAKNLAPTGIRSLDRPARNQSLYRLRYTAHETRGAHIKKKKLPHPNFWVPERWQETSSTLKHPQTLGAIVLTYSMVQSPSWEANWFAASQEIPRILWNAKVHYRIHKRPPPVPILGQPNPVHIHTSHLLEIHPNIIHPSTPRSPQWSLSLWFPHQDPIRSPLLD